MTSTFPPLIQAFSGGFGSAAANAICYPLDLVATRVRTTSSKKIRGLRGILLTIRHIHRTEGWGGLYDGLGTDTLANFLSSFLYFYFYSFLRAILVRRKARFLLPSGKARNPARILLSAPEEIGVGFLAGVASRSIITPLNVITVRLQTVHDDSDDEENNAEIPTPQEPGPVDVTREIYSEDGLQGFWKGFKTAIPLSFNPALTMFLFQIFRRVLNIYQPSSAKLATPSPREAFLGAAFSSTFTTTVLYPLILAKTWLQMQHHEDPESHHDPGVAASSTWLIWKKAYRKNSWSGLYQGLEAQLVKGFVSQGVAMMVKSRVELMIFALYLRQWRKIHS
ncbi:unnamed protein product [Somion occarium]|uniref:Mitochondrial carrier n=1 Tax=Somion occarium TaxID=3059160 RepID=A0ABP1DXS8_9APHY